MKLNRFKKELLAKEFPFLHREGEFKCCKCGTEFKGMEAECPSCGAWNGVSARDIEVLREPGPDFLGRADEIIIRRVDNNLLNQTPWTDSYSWAGGGHCDYLAAYVIVGEKVITLQSSQSWATGSGERGETHAEPIGAQLRALGIRPDYIVLEEFEDTDDNGNGATHCTITVYKNKGNAQTEYERSQLRKAYRELCAELEAAGASN